MRAFLCAVMALATAARAEVPVSSGDTPGFDIIYNVPPVQSIALDVPAGRLFAAVAPADGAPDGGSSIVEWHMLPIRRAALWRTETILSDIELSPDGLVYGAGQRSAPPGGYASGASRSGMVITVDPARPENGPAVFVSFPDNVRVDFSRYNQAAHDGGSRIFVTTPTQFTVTAYPEQFDQGETPLELRLRCGVPAQFSLFGPADRLGYVASTADGAMLEAGLVQPGAVKAPPGECFRVANVFGYKKEPPTLNSVVHAVLGNSSGGVDAVLALEPNTGTLHALGLDSEAQQLSRTDWVDLEGSAPGAFAFLAASRDGSIIFVGGPAQENILRFQRKGGSLAPTGILRTGTGLRQIEISPDGTLAALVMRGADNLDRIHLIHSPGALEEGSANLPFGGDTLRLIQSELNGAGFDVGPADGILGPRTASAISRAGVEDISIESGGIDLKSIIEGVFLTPPE